MDIMDISAPFTDKDAGLPAVQATFNTQVPQVTCKTQSQRKTFPAILRKVNELSVEQGTSLTYSLITFYLSWKTGILHISHVGTSKGNL